MANRSIQLTESISVTNVADSHHAQLSLDVEFAVRVTDTNTQRFSFTISQKLPGTPRPVGRPSKKPLVEYKGFLYQAAGWKTAEAWAGDGVIAGKGLGERGTRANRSVQGHETRRRCYRTTRRWRRGISGGMQGRARNERTRSGIRQKVLYRNSSCGFERFHEHYEMPGGDLDNRSDWRKGTRNAGWP